MPVKRYAITIEIESYAATGRQAAEWAINSLLNGSIGTQKVHIAPLKDDGSPDLAVRDSCYIARLSYQGERELSRQLTASMAKRPIRGCSAI